MEFPRHVYRVPGPHNMGHGITYDLKIVNNKVEFDDALDDGWFNNRQEAIDAPKETAEEKFKKELPSRVELVDEARKLGIKFDGRISDIKLAALIAEAHNGLD